MRTRLAVALIVILVAAIVGTVGLGTAGQHPPQSTARTTSITSVGGGVSGASTTRSYDVNDTFVSRFCSNSTEIGVDGSEAAKLRPSGILSIGPSSVTTGWTNEGIAPFLVSAACIDAEGVLPDNDSSITVGAIAGTLQMTTSPIGQILPGEHANITVTFTNGSEIYYMPQGGVNVTVIAEDGSTASTSGPQGLGYLTTTARPPTPLASIRDASLSAGRPPLLSAVLGFNSSSPIEEVDVSINGTYVGTAGVGQEAGVIGTPSQFDASYMLRIDEPGRLAVVTGDTYMVTFVVVVASGSQETSLSTTVVAG